MWIDQCDKRTKSMEEELWAVGRKAIQVSLIIKNTQTPDPRYFFTVYSVSNRTFLCRHIVNPIHFSAFEIHRSVTDTQRVTWWHRATCAILCNCMCLYDTDSHWPPTDRTDSREKRERERGEGVGRKVEKEHKEGSSLPLPLSILLSSLASFSSYLFLTVFTMPFQYMIRIKRPLHTRRPTQLS